MTSGWVMAYLFEKHTGNQEVDYVIPSEKTAPVSGGKTAPVDVSGGALGRWRAQRTVSTQGHFLR